MKAMILAAGRGERLRPITDKVPKPLVPVGNKRLIEYSIEKLAQAGFNELVINYAHLGEQFPETLGDGGNYNVKIHYSPEESGLETAGGIINAQPLLGNEPFVVVNGDIWTDFDFKSLGKIELNDNRLCHLILVANPGHNSSGDFAIENNGQLSLQGEIKYTFSGIGVYHPKVFANRKVEKLPLKPLLDELIQAGKITAELYSGEWSDIGTLERLKALEQQLNMGS